MPASAGRLLNHMALAQEVSSLLDSNSAWGLRQAILGLCGWRNAPSQHVGVQAAWDGTVRVRR